MSFHVGETFGEYEIKGIIGAGSMGQVYQAEHRLTKRKEAVKVLSAALADPKQIQRFQREIALQAGLNHRNIAAVHNATEVDGRIVLVMEFVEGHTLENLLKAGDVSLDRGLDYICQTLSALSHAHAQGVIHRDVTPANLIVTPDGIVKLTDFGVAKSCGDLELTSRGEVIGSLHYMAPEQVKGGSNPDPRSDVYSVGAILYEMVTRRKLFDVENVLALMLAQVETTPKPPTELDPNLSPEWDALILKALAKDPNGRYASADEFLEVLQRFLSEPSPIAEEPESAPEPSYFPKPKLIAMSALAFALLAAVGLGAMSRFQNPPPPPALTIHIAPPLSAMQFAPPEKAISSAPVVAEKQPAPKRQAQRRYSVKSPPPQLVAKKPADQQLLAPPRIQPAPSPQDVSPELAPSTPEPAPLPVKKSFWGRINPFRKKDAETSGQSGQN